MIDIIYSDDSIVILNKPAGMLSVPGRGPDKQECVSHFIRKKFPLCIQQPSVHRLDMDTSGLMVFALTTKAHRSLSIQFQNSEVKKKYIALLDGTTGGNSGRIELSFRLDPDNRPRQIFDPIQGKKGITLWKKIKTDCGKTRIEFSPLTGRTHQLRLHSVHPAGLGCPIAGDRLYGNSSDEKHTAGDRMMLHASELEFTHPVTGEKMKFSSEPPF